MDTFGDRLKSEREDHGLSIQAVAEILRVEEDLLRALERNEFDALPNESAMRDCLNAYAECLEVDSGLMIEDYVQERDKSLSRLEDIVMKQVAESAPAAISTEPERQMRFSPWLIAPVVAAIAILAWWILSRDRTTPPPEISAATAPVKPQPLPSQTPAGVPPAPVEAPVETPVETPGVPPAEQPSPQSTLTTAAPQDAAVPSPLSILEYGVGTAVDDRRLVGQSSRFTEGGNVSFWTRVQGGTRGHRIYHVWLREGIEAARISLKIGSSNWRTHSTKTLYAGATGDWAVEARDDKGRVLARSEFVCIP